MSGTVLLDDSNLGDDNLNENDSANGSMEFSKKVGISIKKALYVTLKKTIPPIHEDNIDVIETDDDDKMNVTGGSTLKTSSSIINSSKPLKYNGIESKLINGTVVRNLDGSSPCATDSIQSTPTTNADETTEVNPGSPVIGSHRNRSRSVSRTDSETAIKITPESDAAMRRKSVNGDQWANGVTEDKPYECVICSAQFARKSCLNSHLRAHLEGPDKILHSGVDTASELIPNGQIIDQVEDVMTSKRDQKSNDLEEIVELKMEIDDIKTDVELKMETDEKPPMEEKVGSKKVNETKTQPEPETMTNGAIESKDDQQDETDTSGKQYKCYICDARFARNSSLMWHIQFHETHLLSKMKRSTIVDENDAEEGGEDGEFRCTVCERVFTSSVAFRKHMNGAHKLNIDGSPYVPTDYIDVAPGRRPTKCPRCGRMFSTRSNMTKHLRQYCKATTEETFTEDATVEISDELGTTNTELICVPCGGRVFTSRRALHIHAACRHRTSEKNDNDDDSKQDEDELVGQDEVEYNYKCDQCDQTFETYRGMRIHQTYRHGPMIKNDEQTSIVENEDEAELEESEEVDNRAYVCGECDETFDQYRSYSSHIGWHRRRGDPALTPAEEEMGDDTEFKYMCDYCGRGFATSQSKAGHMKAHRSEPPLEDAAAGTAIKKNEAEEADLSDAGSSIELKLSPDVSSSSLSVECRVCGKMLLSKASLGGHMKVHSESERSGDVPPKMVLLPDNYIPQHGDEVLDCAYCGKSFLRKHDLAKHIREHLTGLIKPESIDLSVFKCKYCQRSFSGRKSLNSHMAAHERGTLIDDDHPIAPSSTMGIKRPSIGDGLPKAKFPRNDDKFYKCNICGREFLLRCLLQKHQLLHSGGDELTATAVPDALEKRKRKSTLKDSTYEYGALIGHRCDECGKSFSNRLNLLKHEASHADTPYECPHCDQAFARYDTLLEHSRTHREYQPSNEYALDDDDSDAELECGRRVIVFSPDGYQERFVFDDGPGNEGFLCSECDEVYDDKLQMIIHMSYHVANRRGLKNGLREAIVVKANTTVLAPYQCTFCDERFINKQFRSRHLAKRHKEDVFECDVCHKLFVHRSSLESHCKSHIMEQRWRCPYCHKQFTSKWFWKRHTKKQCPQRKIQEATALRYKCEFCEAVLDEKRLWEEHLQTHVITYGCDNCNFRCENVIELEAHACIVTTTELMDTVQEKLPENGKSALKHNIELAKVVK